MAATDPQRQLLTLIREFASEKSQGERRMIGLKKRIQELGCEVDVANAEMEEVKCIKETTEQELKGNELQLALNEASIQTLEDEISSVGSQVEGLKVV
ncbi:CTAGE FAMILY PROTEIN-RELATED [Salix koriyanagi]|uniref:CTAGE FAMILY PROTEIN-RELATED n=1 Tax=Salix koriyanagi TaxID=2511006 RepID=A0A9Q0SLV1_9ROSI|nr:CTAGE FAMILY PROTEIN-RELATED [Salix koriyanagi]